MKLTSYKINLLFFGVFGVSVFLAVLMLSFNTPSVMIIEPILCVVLLYYMFLVYFIRTVEWNGNALRITYLCRYFMRYKTIKWDMIQEVIYTESGAGIGNLEIYYDDFPISGVSIGCIDNDSDEIKSFLDELYLNGINVTCRVYNDVLADKFYPYTKKADQE